MRTRDLPVSVLLIEDDQDDAYLIRDLLSDVPFQRYELEWAADCGDALERLLCGTFDVCLLDYCLGTGSGLDLLKDARSRRCKVPIILLTAFAD